MEKAYDHKLVEDRIYSFWESNNCFASKITPSKDKFVVMMPPPNITGRLHIGHALTFTLQDVFVRFNRMNGKETLWLPGMDHAGIATQSVVERELLGRGIKREDLGREKFVEEIWKWKESYGNTIVGQLKKVGASPDWSKLRFTLDKEYADAVTEAFVRYYNEGLLYRGERIINWCPHCHTALSDIEVEYQNESGHLYFIKYPFEDDPENYIVVATTRPETMLGDTAVAVNPNDERYKEVVGRTVVLPIVERKIEIIADDSVDPDFGTGAVKVTPSHSMEDFETGKRHNLEFITVIDDKARMINVPEKYLGLSASDARNALVEDLQERGYLLKIVDYEHSVGHCQRCGTIVEPIVSKQWFLSMKSLAEVGMDAVQNGLVKITPEKWVKVYYDWLRNIRDWCVSRQLWWGHRIPAYYCDDCGEVIVSKTKPEVCPKCGSKRISQDEDVLDTWFSSALWPFATLGWPNDTPELNYYYPTSLLITGYDILFFWVARMIMSGLHFTNKQPFDTVMIHGLVRDEKGKKMSKSLKNIVDPLTLIDEFGADSLRFTLASLSTVGGQDINLSNEKLKASRNFINKVWNASRFVIMNLEGFDPYSFDESETEIELEDRWFLSRLNRMIKREVELLSDYNLGDASRELYDFVWSDFCDWYIELSKVRLYGENEHSKRSVQFTLFESLSKVLKMLHPFIPFVTEEIYSYLPHKDLALIVSEFPKEESIFENEDVEKEASFIFEVIGEFRSLKTEFGLPIVKGVSAYFTSFDPNEAALIEQQKSKISKIAGLTELTYVESKPKKTVKGVVGQTTVFIQLPETVDLSKEKASFIKKLEATEKVIRSITGRLMNQTYLLKADPEIIKKDRADLDEAEKLKRTILSHIEDLE
ncbi:MAG: valine--tRNA ligase [Caldisericaceae bacterium]